MEAAHMDGSIRTTIRRSRRSSPVGDFEVARSHWSSEEILGDLTSAPLDIGARAMQNVREEMWRNVVAEFDAMHLSDRFRKNERAFSAEFMTFEAVWAHDEMNHYNGLKRIYSTLCGMSESDVDSAVRARKADFSAIEAIIGDEFVACVCLAYDELASVRGYAAAFPLYDGFGPPGLKRWIRLTARDEMLHSLNAQNLLKTVHRHRLSEVPSVLRTIVAHESPDPSAYKGTFLFDHGEAPGDNPFSKDFLRRCANDVCRALGVAPSFIEGTFV
jgi:hypothetical protein